MALDGAAADDLSGLEDVLGGLRKILGTLEVECDLSLPGAWEIARRGGSKESPISWNDSGTLRVVKEVPGGTLDPGKLVSGLARAGDRLGAIIAENHPVERVEWGDEATIHFAGGCLRARKVLFATNGLSLRLSGMHRSAVPKLTLAALNSPLSEKQLEEIGLAERKPFYTVDFPYLWGRVCNDNSLVLGAGLLDAPESDDPEEVEYCGAGRDADVCVFRAARARAASGAEGVPVHAPLGRADSISRGLAACVCRASGKRKRNRPRRVRGTWRGAVVIPGRVGGGGAARPAQPAGMGRDHGYWKGALSLAAFRATAPQNSACDTPLTVWILEMAPVVCLQ